MRKKTKPSFMNSTFWISALAVLLAVLWGVADPEGLSAMANATYAFTTDAFGWFYLVAVLAIVIFLFALALSKYGKVRLGKAGDKPKYSFYTWIGMLFSCGFGAGLVFWGVAEPMSHFLKSPLPMVAGSPEAARTAMQYSFFNWGIHQWSVFALVGLALAYFQFKKGEKGEISTTLLPVIGRSEKNPLPKMINILAVIATVMGVATSMGMGILQINGGLDYLFAIPQNNMNLIVITLLLLGMYLMSAVTGLDKGIKRLSNLNLSMALGLVLVVVFLGPTRFIIDSFLIGVMDYGKHFFGMSLGMIPNQDTAWTQEWTVGYWAWVIAWSPFVGSFIARISEGRTIREFIFGVMIVPPAIATIWIGVFGGTALHMDFFQNANIAGAVQEDVTSALFATFANFPMSTLLSVVFILLIVTFLVTSADSATFILGMMTSGGNLNPSTMVKVIWGVLMAAIVVVLLMSSGLQGLQTASLITALPFTVILLMIGIALLKTLREDFRTTRLFKNRSRSSLTGNNKAQ